MQLIIPMTGQGTRFQAAGYKDPKPLISVNGSPIIERLLKVYPPLWESHFILAQNHNQTGLPELLKKLRPDCKIYYLEPHKEGPLKAVEYVLEQIPDDEGILISYCDFGMSWDPVHFEKFLEFHEYDAVVICYRGFHAHYLGPTTYAYCRLENDQVIEVREKGSFTENRELEFASCGAYYFKNKEILKKAAFAQREKKLIVNGEFYISLTVEALIQADPNTKIGVYEIPYFYQWGTPEDLENFEYWEKTLKYFYSKENQFPTVEQLLMPMAGHGKRFKEAFLKPKPFIKVHQTPMYLRALRSLPQSSKSVFVVTKTHTEFEEFKKLQSLGQVAVLESTPPGQALSTMAGLELLNPNQEVLISACDHALKIDHKQWELRHHQTDAIIFTIKGYPGVKRSPNSYAYVEILEESKNESSQTLTLVKKVYVKEPIPNKKPSQSDLLVGTFWFKNVELAKAYIKKLQNLNLQVNKELYLDSIFNLMIHDGLLVRCSNLKAYIGWGDLESAAESMYWLEHAGGTKFHLRGRLEGLS